MLLVRRNSELLTARADRHRRRPARGLEALDRELGEVGDRLEHDGEGAGQRGEGRLAVAARGIELLPRGGDVGVAAGRQAEGVGDAGVGAGRERLRAVGGDVVEGALEERAELRSRASGSCSAVGENRPARKVVGPAENATEPLGPSADSS